MTPHVLCLPVPGFGWTTSSYLLLLLKDEFILNVSLSKNSLKLPLCESECFTILLVLSVVINVFVKYFMN
jgi:hypothetical protein